MNIEYKLANIVINIASKYNLPYNKIYTLLYNEFIIKREVIDILENEIIYFMDNYERSKNEK